MAKNSSYRNHSRVFHTPRRPFGRERLDAELKLCGEFGLRNKREIWRAKYTLAKIRKTARSLLTLEEKDAKRIFEGAALMRRLHRYGLLPESQEKLDYVLSLKVEDLLRRRLQSIIVEQSHANSVHEARVMIRQRHIRVGSQVVDVPSFLVRVSSEKFIDFAENSSRRPGGPAGRVLRKKKVSETPAEE
eukprot:gnl/Dysnectes_brevis/422_a465_9493.p2 GENE.gnl/Dysnectes_brevis/422_a465_9493~~gnl/Dysnectes_brevis/422_a465_9493.p2  ORF type:complete len:189 (-),score=56.74 gnl/Dysnectes_brevis/422_a465_9493:79-645(-)